MQDCAHIFQSIPVLLMQWPGVFQGASSHVFRFFVQLMVWALALLKVGCTIFMGTNDVYSFCLAMICLFFGVFISSCVVTLLVCWQHVFEAGFMQSFFSWYFQVKYRDLLRSTWHRPFQRTLLSLNPGRGIRISAILASRLVSTMPDMLLGHGFSWFIGKYPLQKCIRTQFCVL